MPDTTALPERKSMHCDDTTCPTAPCWRLSVAHIPGFYLYACAEHLLLLLGSGRDHVLEKLPETQPA